MCIIIREMMNLFWIIGLLWSGVITSGDVTAAPAVGTRTSKNESSAFMISIKIINQIYNDSLEDHQSQNYKTLRQKVENVFFEIYKFTPSVQYQEITEMTFSNGSVIANSTVIFGSKQKSGEIVKQIFVKNYMQHHSPLRLDLNINYTADQEAIAVPSMTISISIPKTHDNSTNSAISTTSASISTNGLDKSKDKTQPPKTSTQAHSNNSPSNSPSDNMTPTTSPSRTHMFDSSAPTTNPSHNILTTSASSFSTSTVHTSNKKTTTSASISSTPTTNPSHNILTTSASSFLTTTVHTSNKTTTTSASISSTPTTNQSHNISTTSASTSSTTTVRPRTKISAMSTSSSSEIQSKTITQKPTGPEGSDTVATVQGVPGWGIAILVLAAIILFFMLVLLILLLLFWCCCWKQRGFMHVSDPDPTGYYNPDIPMYSTQSTYDSHNGKSLDLDPERPQKNRSGTYTVNK